MYQIFISLLATVCLPVYGAYPGRPGIVLKPSPPLQSIILTQPNTTPSPTTKTSIITFHTSFGDWINGQIPKQFPGMPGISEAIEGQGDISNDTRKFGTPDNGYVGILTPTQSKDPTYEQSIGPDQPYVISFKSVKHSV